MLEKIEGRIAEAFARIYGDETGAWFASVSIDGIQHRVKRSEKDSSAAGIIRLFLGIDPSGHRGCRNLPSLHGGSPWRRKSILVTL